jgi:citrate synthase
VRSLLSQANLLTYDPGFMCTASCISNICYINGEKGELLYRGYRIQDLAEHSSYMETCYLLLYGTLPSSSELRKFEEVVSGEMMINEKMIEFYKGFRSEAHPMAIMVGVVGALSAFLHSDYDLFNPRDRQEMAIKLIAKMPTLAAYAYRTAMGLPIVYPKKHFSYMKNFLYMMFSNPMSDTFDIDEEILRALEVIWICHAEHEQNASTSTVRIAGSSHANPFACIAAGIGSLWGPYHGGANEAVLNMLEEILHEGASIREILERSKDKNSNFRLMGFGHRVYKNFDPRATIMQKMCYTVLDTIQDNETKPLLDLAINLEKEALADDYFIKRKLYPNVDFYTGIVYKAIGIPKDMFTVLFAVSRSVGWMAHWCEMMNENTNRISRPRQMYVGSKHRDYEKIEERSN